MSNSSDDDAQCGYLGPTPLVPSGPMTLAEWLTLPAYLISILLMLAGPSSLTLCGWLPEGLIKNNIYAPAMGVIYLSFVHLLTGGAVPAPLLTAATIGGVLGAKYHIIVLILSFAYIAISLDESGLFRMCALRIVVWSKGDGVKLFRLNFLLCSILTYFTSNDIVTMAMSPILIYTCHFAKIANGKALLINTFVAANTASTGLYIGSPSNVILGDAARMTFVDYFLWMFFPTVVGTISTLVVLELLFIRAPFLDRSAAMQRSFEPVSEDQMEQVLYGQEPAPAGAAPEAEPGPRPAVVLDAGTTPAAGADAGAGADAAATAEVRLSSQSVSFNIKSAPQSTTSRREQPQLHSTISMVDGDATELALGDAPSGSVKQPQGESGESDESGESRVDAAPVDGEKERATAQVDGEKKRASIMRSRRTIMVKLSILGVCLVLLTISSFISLELWSISVAGWVVVACCDALIVRAERGSLRAYFWMVTKRMPWEVAFYVTFMFSMVAVLGQVGFTGRFASWMLVAAGPSSYTASLSFGYISAFLANVLCDLPATAFWSDMLRILCDGLSAATYRVVVLALLLGNTFGCYMTTVGALAGLMWLNIMRTAPGHDRLVLPNALDLTKFGVPTACVVLLLTCTVVWLEVLVVYGSA